MLKYLFIAEYSDGATYIQTQEDKSIVEPEKRSAFFDVDHDRLVKFSLIGQGMDNPHTYSVDLRDGHFEVDGVPFYFHEEDLLNFKLIFFRRHTHTKNQSSGHETHAIAYKIGWQCLVNGKNYQQTMLIH